MRYWPEHLLLHYFKEDLDQELCNTCVFHGVNNHIHDWYQMAVAMDLEIHSYCKETSEKKPRRQFGQ